MTDDWMVDALCAQTDPDAFNPETGGSLVVAKKICSLCPVRNECLEYALVTNQQASVWGGLTLGERRRLMRERRNAA